VVFENSYQSLQAKYSSLVALPSNRTAYAYMVHAVPSITAGLVDQWSQSAKYLFATSLSENFYESFDPELATFCNVLPTA
jgi:hypothetical protein